MNVNDSVRVYESYVETYDWLVAIIRELPETEFTLAPIGRVSREKKRIVDMLREDTSFKLVSRLESDLKRDLRETIEWGTSTAEPLSVAYNNLWMSWRGQYNSDDMDRFLRYTRFEDVLDVIRNKLSAPDQPLATACSYLKARYNSFRHWYAHGRTVKSAPYIPPPAGIAPHCEIVARAVIARPGR